METDLFNEVQNTLATEGPDAAIDRLCDRLREKQDYNSLFYGLLMKKRHALGVSPLPTGPAQEIPASVHPAYEEAIRDAGREVCQLYLDQGNIAQAWLYARMLGESGPIAAALEKYQPAESEDIQTVVQIAYYEGVHPRRGFDLILDHLGLCNAITTLSSQEVPQAPDVRLYCVRRLVRALYQELCERLAADVARRQTPPPSIDSGHAGAICKLMAGNDWVFEDEGYHIDLSHLAGVVQMSTELSPGEELEMARELCAYGQRLSPALHFKGDPPFDDQYRDYGVFLALLAGDSVEAGIKHFQTKVDHMDVEEVGTFPAEVLINLLLRLDRPVEALAIARKHLVGVESRRLSCPNLIELCRGAGDYASLAEMAREQGDPVHYLAGLLAAQKR